MNFPLTEKATKAGVFELAEGFVISAPTATGKSRIGMDVMKKFCETKYPVELGMYIVPFKALADEVHLTLKELLPGRKIAIKTGDYDVEPNLADLDVVVATYESAEGLLRQGESVVWPRVVVADEISYISDRERGVRIEGLLSYLAKRKNVRIYSLSAVLKEPSKVVNWLGSTTKVNLLKGTDADRPSKLETSPVPYSEGSKDAVVIKLVKEWLPRGNIIVFCDTKADTRNLSQLLSTIVWETMPPGEREKAKRFADQLRLDFPYMIDMPERIEKGVAYHNADLEPELRKLISKGFADRTIKLVCATTTLSAGINLPARTVIVRDTKRRHMHLIPVSETLNMLGRAGRPGLDSEGTGFYLMQAGYNSRPDETDFVKKVQGREVEDLVSSLPLSNTNLMVFILATVSRAGRINRKELMSAFKSTFWAVNSGVKLPDTVPDKGGLISLLSSYAQEDVIIDHRSCSFREGTLSARGGSQSYEISFSESSMYCSCPGYRFNRRCKHLGFLAHEVLAGTLSQKFGDARGVILAHMDQLVEAQPGYRIANALWRLIEYGFVVETKDEETQEESLTLARDGTQALVSYLLSMGHIRKLRDRIRAIQSNPRDHSEVIRWALQDLPAPIEDTEDEDESTERLLKKFLEELYPFHAYLNGRYYRDAYLKFPKLVKPYLVAKDRLAQILNAYLAFCPPENKDLREMILIAKRRIEYGCPESGLPLAVLNFEEIPRPDMIQKLNAGGIRNVWDLSGADYSLVAKIAGISSVDSAKLVERAMKTAELLKDFPTDKPGIFRLSQRAGVSVDDLLSYCKPG